MRCTDTAATKATLATILTMLTSLTCADGTTTSFSGYGTVGGTFTGDGSYAYYHNSTEFTARRTHSM
jgi:hypothetical protein